MRELNNQMQPCDLLTVDNELSRKGTLAGVGGTAYLIELSQSVPSTVNARAYMQIVDEKSTLRRLISAGSDISTACYSQAEPVSDILGMAEIRLLVELLTGYFDFACVDNNHIIPGIQERCEGRLVLAPEDRRCLRCKASERHPLRIDYIPFSFDRRRGGNVGFHLNPPWFSSLHLPVLQLRLTESYFHPPL
jgi:hypothetical protein